MGPMSRTPIRICSRTHSRCRRMPRRLHCRTMKRFTSWPCQCRTSAGKRSRRNLSMTRCSVRFVLGALLLLIACGKWSDGRRRPSSAGEVARRSIYTIAVVPQGSTHEFWKSIHAGAMKTAGDFRGQGIDINVIWKGPMREDDREQQVQVVEGFVTQRVNGIVLAPFDKNALVRPVEEAAHAGIPTVVIDSGLESTAPISF